MYESYRGKYCTFYDKSFVIIKDTFTRDINKYAPEIEIRDNAAYILMKLCKLQYGTMAELKKMTLREIIQILNFERFYNDYDHIITERIEREKNGS